MTFHFWHMLLLGKTQEETEHSWNQQSKLKRFLLLLSEVWLVIVTSMKREGFSHFFNLFSAKTIPSQSSDLFYFSPAPQLLERITLNDLLTSRSAPVSYPSNLIQINSSSFLIKLIPLKKSVQSEKIPLNISVFSPEEEIPNPQFKLSTKTFIISLWTTPTPSPLTLKTTPTLPCKPNPANTQLFQPLKITNNISILSPPINIPSKINIIPTTTASSHHLALEPSRMSLLRLKMLKVY